MPTTVNGKTANYKVYMTKDVNAWAMANGCIRVYSGLMDLMNDDELRGVIGHEIGHVALGHSKSRMQTAYAASAVRGLADQRLPPAGGHRVPEELGVLDVPGRDDVGGPAGAEPGGQVPRPRVQAGLGRPVRAAAAQRRDRAERDHARVRRTQPGQHRGREQHRGEHVQPPLVGPLGGHLGQRAGRQRRGATGGVDHGVDVRPGCLRGLGHRPLDLVGLGQVGGDRVQLRARDLGPDRRDRSGQRVRPAAEHDDRPAVPGQRGRRGPADPGTPAGHVRDPGHLPSFPRRQVGTILPPGTRDIR